MAAAVLVRADGQLAEPEDVPPTARLGIVGGGEIRRGLAG